MSKFLTIDLYIDQTTVAYAATATIVKMKTKKRAVTASSPLKAVPA